MTPTRFLIVAGAFVLLAACSRAAVREEVRVTSEQKQAYGEEEQRRNAPCWQDGDCAEGATCEGETSDAAGSCQIACKTDADCGNGFVCRPNGCQRDCAEIGEKCSDRRPCCFFDGDGNRKSDAVCAEDDAGDMRCRQAGE